MRISTGRTSSSKVSGVARNSTFAGDKDKRWIVPVGKDSSIRFSTLYREPWRSHSGCKRVSRIPLMMPSADKIDGPVPRHSLAVSRLITCGRSYHESLSANKNHHHELLQD